jgi:site-specific recombinase XerD
MQQTASSQSSDASNIILKRHALLTLESDFLSDFGKKGRSTNTLKNYKTDLDCFNGYLLTTQGHDNIQDFSLPQVKLYGDYLQTRYKSDNSRRRRVQTLRIFFDYLVARHLFSSNPVRSLPTSPKFLDKPRPTSLIDIKTLWQCLLEESFQDNPIARVIARRNQVLVLFIYGAGLKVSDLQNLTQDQIIISDDKSTNQAPRVLIHHPKRDPYTVPLPAAFTSVYLDYLRELKSVKEQSDVDFNEVLFNANAFKILSGGLSARGIEMVLEHYRKKLIIEVTPKSLRQSCIFEWLQADHNDTTIKDWTGVAPSYSLALYKAHINEAVFSNEFLLELYLHAKKKH